MKPFLFLRGNGIWYIGTIDARGKRKSISTRAMDRGTAESVLSEYEKSHQSESNGPLLSAFTDEVLEFIGASFTRKTKLIYRDALRALKRHTGDIPIDLVTVRDVDRFKTARVKQIKPISVNKDLATLKAAFNQALRWEYIKVNPFSQTKKLRIPDKPPAYFTRQEIRQVIRACEHHWLHDLVIVALNTGMRVGELTNLRWTHVDMKRRMIRIANGDGFQTKTGKGNIVPMNDIVAAVLEERMKRGEEHVFTMRDRQIKKNWVSSAFKKVLRREGIREELHFHSLRHTFASWLVQDGVSLYQVSRLLGHSDVKTTEMYAHLQPDMMHDIVERLTM